MNVRTALAAAAIVACAVPAAAFTVEVALLESMASPEASMAYSEAVIDGAMDGLFESGSIATNARPEAGGAEAFARFVPPQGSREASVDFVIIILALYSGEQSAAGAISVPECRYRLLRVSDGSELASGSVSAASPESALERDVLKACKATGRAVALACGKVLSTVSASWRIHAYHES